MTTPVAWTIAGSDSSSGAGIQAHLKTMSGLGVYCCTVVTALTAQNTLGISAIEAVSLSMLEEQIKSLALDLPPGSINLGLLYSAGHCELIAKYIQELRVPVVCDPVMIASSGDRLLQDDAVGSLRSFILPLSAIVTPNLPEALFLLGLEKEIDLADIDNDLATDELIESLATRLLSRGPQSVLIKGGHRQGKYCQDFWTDGNTKIWLTSKNQSTFNTHGTGCTLSAGVTAALAAGYSIVDAIVIAKAYVNQGLRLAPKVGGGHGPLAHSGWPECQDDLPWISSTAEEGRNRTLFLQDHQLSFYPIVNRAARLETLFNAGVKTVQLRVKDLTEDELENEVERACRIARAFRANLYVNDYWQLAIKHQAFGVHLGQEDLAKADIERIQSMSLRLGISTHNYAEVSRALGYRPSYIAIGPIHATTTKKMVHAPQGLAALSRWRRSLDYPLVAIGGIFLANAREVLNTGVDGIAVVRDICESRDPASQAQRWLTLFDDHCLSSANQASMPPIRL